MKIFCCPSCMQLSDVKSTWMARHLNTYLCAYHPSIRIAKSYQYLTKYNVILQYSHQKFVQNSTLSIIIKWMNNNNNALNARILCVTALYYYIIIIIVRTHCTEISYEKELIIWNAENKTFSNHFTTSSRTHSYI